MIDENGDLIKSEVDLKNIESSISEEFKVLKDIFFGMLGGEKDEIIKYDYRFIELKKSKLRPPTNIYIYANDTIKIEIFEKSHFSLNVGLNSAQIELQDFKLENGMLTISPDSAKKEVWKEHLFVGFAYHPFGRGPNFDPRLFNYSYGNIWSRFGIWGGFNLSKKPFDNLYLGLSYELSKKCYNFKWSDLE